MAGLVPVGGRLLAVAGSLTVAPRYGSKQADADLPLFLL